MFLALYTGGEYDILLDAYMRIWLLKISKFDVLLSEIKMVVDVIQEALVKYNFGKGYRCAGLPFSIHSLSVFF